MLRRRDHIGIKCFTFSPSAVILIQIKLLKDACLASWEGNKGSPQTNRLKDNEMWILCINSNIICSHQQITKHELTTPLYF